MPKQLMFDMYKGYMRNVDEYTLAAINDTVTQPDIVPETDTDIDTGVANEPTA